MKAKDKRNKILEILIRAHARLPPIDSAEYKMLMEIETIAPYLTAIRSKQNDIYNSMSNSEFSNMTSLDLSRSHIDNNLMSKISVVVGNGIIERLILSQNWIGDIGVSSLGSVLSKNNTLIELRLDNNLISDEGAGSFLAQFKINTTLEILDLSYNRVSTKGIDALVSKLSKPQLSGALSAVLLTCNNIDTESAAKLLRCLSTNSTLRELSLGYNNIESPLTLTPLMFSGLDKIDLSYNWLKANDAMRMCRVISNNTCLKEINIEGHSFNSILDLIKDAIKLNHTLTSLKVMSELGVQDKDIEWKLKLNQLPKPKEVENDIEGLNQVQEVYYNFCNLNQWPEVTFSYDYLTSIILCDNNIRIIPPNIDRFKTLKILDLRSNRIAVLPPTIGFLTGLESLLLSDNKLHFFPQEMAKLTSLRRLYLRNNPATLVPIDCLSSIDNLDEYQFSKTKLFKYLQNPIRQDQCVFNKCKIMIVGEPSVGKTTLSKVLGLDIKWYNRIGVAQKGKFENIATDGIDISTITTSQESQDITWEVWDYGGHDVYKTTHSFFLAPRTIYLVLFNFMDVDKHRLEYWLQSIRTKAGSRTAVVLVGTHSDSIRSSQRDSMVAQLKALYKSHVREVLYISNINYEGINTLKSYISKLAKEYGLVGTKVNRAWVDIATQISKLRLTLPYVDVEQIHGLFESNGIKSHQYTDIMNWLSDIGEILRFDAKNVNRIVFIDPQFLCKMFSEVVSMKHQILGNNDGILPMTSLINTWKLPHSVKIEFLKLLQDFNVATVLVDQHVTDLTNESKLDENVKVLVPALLPDEKPDNFDQLWDPNLQNLEYKRIYKFAFLPFGFFSKVLIRILHLPDIDELCYWKYGIVGKRKDELFSIIYKTSKTQLTLKVSGLKEGTCLPTMASCIQSTISEWYPSSDYTILIPVVFNENQKKEKYFINQNEITSLIDDGIYFKTVGEDRRVDFLSCVPDLALLDIKDLEIDYSELDNEDLLGRGSFGQVFCSEYDGEPVAVKSLKWVRKHSEKDFLDENEYHKYRAKLFDNFKHEIRIMYMLRHETIVALKGFTTSPIGIVMEYIPHGNLFEYIKTHKSSFDWKLRIRIALNIAWGMKFMHSYSPPLCHRDLRSENILLASLNPSDHVVAKIADFGLAAFVFDSLGKSPNESFMWLAPEVMNHKPHSHKSDVFSFGAIISELINTEYPYHPHKMNETNRIRIKNGELVPNFPDSFEHENEEYILQFSKLGSQCCSFDPQNRPSFHDIVTIMELLARKFGLILEYSPDEALQVKDNKY